MTAGGRAPRVSVVVPSFDHAEFVVATVRSVLDQTMADFELLVLDDGSRDDSLERLAAIRDPRMTLLSHPNRGLSATLNRGLALARAPWVKFLPSDDMLAPTCLARQLEAAEAAGISGAPGSEDPPPSAQVIFCLPEVVDREGFPLRDDPAPQAWFDVPHRDLEQILPALVERNFLSAPGALFPAELARSLGGFDANLRIAQDYDLWLRLLPRCRAARLLPERLVRVRWHGGNQSAVVTTSSEAERERAVRRALEETPLEGWFRGIAATGPARADRALSLAVSIARSGLPDLAPFARGLVTEAHSHGAVAIPEELVALTGSGGAERRPGDAMTSGGRLAPIVAGPEADSGAGGESNDPGNRAASRRDLAGRRRGPLRALLAAWRRTSSRHAPATTALREDLRPVGNGPRSASWLLLGGPAIGDGGQRVPALAAALSAGGAEVAWAMPGSSAGPAGGAVRVDFRLGALRGWLDRPHERVRVLVEAPLPEAVAVARECGTRGARVVYEKIRGTAEWRRLAGIHPDDERALLEVADDVVSPSRELLREAAGGRRPAVLLPDPEPGVASPAGWSGRASALCSLVEDPTLTVVIPAAGPGQPLLEAVASVRRASVGRPWRLAVVDAGLRSEALAPLEELEEKGALQLLRDARRAHGSALALGLRGTRSELVLWLQPEVRLRGAGGLDRAIASLLGRREVGLVAVGDAVDATAPEGVEVVEPSVGAWLLPRGLLFHLGTGLEPVATAAEAGQLVSRWLRRQGFVQLLASGPRAGEEPDHP